MYQKKSILISYANIIDLKENYKDQKAINSQ